MKKLKSLDKFYKRKTNKCGYRNPCIQCNKKIQKEYRENNKDKIKECRLKNKEKIKAYRKEYYLNNKEEIEHFLIHASNCVSKVYKLNKENFSEKIVDKYGKS